MSAIQPIPPQMLSEEELNEQRFAFSQLEALHRDAVEARLSAMESSEKAKYIELADMVGAVPNRLMLAVSERGTPRSIWGFKVAIPISPKGTDPVDTAILFLKQFRGIWAMDDPEVELIPMRVRKSEGGTIFVTFQQVSKGGMVFRAQPMVEVTQDGEFVSFSGTYVPHVSKMDVSKLSAQEAESQLLMKKDAKGFSLYASMKGIFDPYLFGLVGSVRPVWKISGEIGDVHPTSFYIDGETGELLFEEDEVDYDKIIKVYQCNGCSYEVQLPGTLIWETGQQVPPSWPGTTWYAYTFTNDTYDYYWNVHGRDSWDNNPGSQYHRMAISADVQESDDFPSSRWVQAKQQVATLANQVCRDVVGHEFTHGVDMSEGNLQGTPDTSEHAALNESYPDAFGEFIERWKTGSADWLHRTGAGCTGANRSLADPCGFPDLHSPDNFSNFGYAFAYKPPSKYRNAGIANKAVYLLGVDPPHTEVHWGISVSSIGWQDTSRVWYDVLVNRIGPTDGYATFGRKTIDSAGALFNWDWRFVQTRLAIYAVGIWTGEGQLGIASDRAVAMIANFPINGQFRKWIFWKRVGSSAPVYGAWRDCAIVGSCSWSAPMQLQGSWTDGSVSAVVYQAKIWVFYKGGSNQSIYYNTIDSTGNVSSAVALPSNSQTDNEPGVAVVANKMVLAYRNAQTGTLSVRVHNGSSWLDPVTSSYEVSTGVRVVHGLNNGWAWISYGKLEEGGLLLTLTRYNPDTGVWDGQGEIAEKRKIRGFYDTPGSAVYKNRWHVSAVGDGAETNALRYGGCGDVPLCVSFNNEDCHPSYWSRFVRQDKDLSPAQSYTTLFADSVDGRLYLFARHPGSNDIYWRFKFSQ